MSSAPHSCLRPGRGHVPRIPLLSAAKKQLCELPHESTLGGRATIDRFGSGRLDFTQEGISPQQWRDFFNDAVEHTKKKEPIIESGNRYITSDDFHRMNGDLLMHEWLRSEAHRALSESDQARAKEFLDIVFYTGVLRSRNPLHATALETALLGNLMNFPKHIFGFPFASYASDGNESLSLVLYSYRQLRPRRQPRVLFIAGVGEPDPPADVQRVAERLGLGFDVVSSADLHSYANIERVVAAMTSFTSPALATSAAWAEQKSIGLHIHIQDAQWRAIFAENNAQVHFDLPAGVRSLSIQEGLMKCGYQLYRDLRLRDLHMDLGYAWQTAYLSPNEGGSGNAIAMLVDFCLVCLGWSALRCIARQGASAAAEMPDTLQPTFVSGDFANDMPKVGQGAAAFDEIQAWAKECTAAPVGSPGSTSREELDRCLAAFQRNFLGGHRRELEVFTSGGGTRSISMAFESVCVRAKAELGPNAQIKVITGNPHLAVERAERRFQFTLIRVDEDGALSVERLKREISDPLVVAVFAQSLSYTDGVSDPTPAIVEVLEAENLKRQQAKAMPITLINDNCLAFCVLLHSPELRVLDMTENLITPTIVTLDAHKHLGTDKGISTVIGTPGTLSRLQGRVRVGAQPSKGELSRALADMLLIGVEGYKELYHSLVSALDAAADTIKSTGLTIVHAKNRVKGSSVLAIEDPSSKILKKMKKLGHSMAMLFNIYPDDPRRCQTGWSVSFTPYSLRHVRGDKRALDVFVSDLQSASKEVKASPNALAKLFRENSMPAILLSGGVIDPWIFALLQRGHFARSVAETVMRAFFSLILDSGTVCSSRSREAPIKELMGRAGGASALLFLILVQLRRMMSKRLRSSKL